MSLPAEEVFDALIGWFSHHSHWLVLQRRITHLVINVLVLFKHAQLHLCLHAHGLMEEKFKTHFHFLYKEYFYFYATLCMNDMRMTDDRLPPGLW